ncbi:hypothetical protein GWK87_07135 [Staphylococcus schleiferi subsp. coagulans]|uniref:T3SS effector HopA1 family protein n=1 Tax=Staphylococcus coagulans TaxID=74706 RepID=UPI0015FB55A1|nr:T3SS effector HopA1 family protein [Staphylococcus coagulans]MBA8760065.1 hypothetical protein [Staphylococcus coagulans]MBA8768796.1 hypothetical protein [Staphylococcus coagulans]
MIMNDNSIESLTHEFLLEVDLDRVRLLDKMYTGVLEKPKNELMQWLYAVLHTGNIKIEKQNTIKTLNDLDDKIIKQLKDPGILTPAKVQEINNKKYPMIHGIRIKEEVNNQGTIKLPCFRPNLTPGFFMFVNTNEERLVENMKRHYVYADTPEYAINMWGNCVKQLIQHEVSFSSKVLSTASNYPRNDALVFYSSHDKNKVESILIECIQQTPLQIKNGSRIAKRLCYNLYTADDPIQTNHIQQSFGEHRCSAIADAIQDHFITGVDFKLLLKQRLLSYNINIKDVSENLTQ